MRSKEKQEMFLNALQGRKIPVLTLDNKWYKLLDETGKEAAQGLAEELNMLLKRQGKLNTETKKIKGLKRKLMNEIVSTVAEVERTGNSALEKKIDENRILIDQCNEKLEAYREELLELPGQIQRVNFNLMLMTMECCYDTMHQNSEEIQKISEWVRRVRIELKENLVRKQEMESRNQAIYAYMHDVFGAEIVDLFDMKNDMEA